MSSDTPVQPKIGDLLADYLRRQTEAQAAGLASPDADAEVLAYEAGPVRLIDAKLAWDETLTVAKSYGCECETQGQMPPGWPNLVAGLEPVVALACALGNFPQMVRNFQAILQSRNLAQLRPSSARSPRPPENVGDLLEWADRTAKGNAFLAPRSRIRKNAGKGESTRILANAATDTAFPQLLLVLGVLRLAKQFEHADKIVKRHNARVPATWRPAWDNEKAALAWHRGEADEANNLWQRQKATPMVLFNRGMSELFLDRPEKAKESLTQAVAELPEAGAWHHLGRLYLALAKEPRTK